MRAALALALAAADTCDLPLLPSFAARPARIESDCPRVYVYDLPQLYDYDDACDVLPPARRRLAVSEICLRRCPRGEHPRCVFSAARARCAVAARQFSRALCRSERRAVQRGEIDVMQTLAGIPKTKIQELRRNLAGVAPMLQYSIDDSVRNDAFEALLQGALAVATERERLRDGHARHESAVVLNALL